MASTVAPRIRRGRDIDMSFSSAIFREMIRCRFCRHR